MSLGSLALRILPVIFSAPLCWQHQFKWSIIMQDQEIDSTLAIYRRIEYV